MNASVESIAPSPVPARAGVPAVRPMYWSIRRELWENRSVLIVPSVTALLVAGGCSMAAWRLPEVAGLDALADPSRPLDALLKPYGLAGTIITLAMMIVGAIYCLGALHNDRRDRSILFWKSLPVSDRTTVLAKASIPLVVLPLLSFVLVVAAHVVMLLASTVVLRSAGESATALWSRFPLLHVTLVQFYGFVVIALWHAPLYAWLLLVSGWASRVPSLWAVLPPLGLCVAEWIGFGSSHFAAMLMDRLRGGEAEAYFATTDTVGIDPLPHVDLQGFLGSPGLWIGLVVAALFLAAAVWSRRHRAPI